MPDSRDKRRWFQFGLRTLYAVERTFKFALFNPFTRTLVRWIKRRQLSLRELLILTAIIAISIAFAQIVYILGIMMLIVLGGGVVGFLVQGRHAFFWGAMFALPLSLLALSLHFPPHSSTF